jgi:hypothetical protein
VPRARVGAITTPCRIPNETLNLFLNDTLTKYFSQVHKLHLPNKFSPKKNTGLLLQKLEKIELK